MDRCWKKTAFMQGRGTGLMVVVVAIVIALGSASGEASALPATGVQVGSSLSGLSVLPSRAQWIATVKPLSVIISTINFLIDGKVIWVDKGRPTPPFVFGGDYYNGTNKGFLITTWLTPGEHQFTVQAITSAGAIEDTTTARVTAAPKPPAALAGTWTRTVTPADTQKGQAQDGGIPPTGTWHLVFDQVGAWELDPKGSGLANQYTVSGQTLNMYAPITMAPEGITRFGHHAIGGTDCTPAGPFGTYSWSVTGNQLTLTATHEGCPNREVILEGTWIRSATLR